MSAETKLENLGLLLPPPAKPAGAYRPAVVVGSICYLSGHLPICADGALLTGRVGEELDQQGGYHAAWQCGLAMLSTLRANLGDLDRVARVVKILGMVNATPEFEQHPAVINGCSELFAEIWGPECGVGARSAIGVASLPFNVCVEIEALFEITTPTAPTASSATPALRSRNPAES